MRPLLLVLIVLLCPGKVWSARNDPAPPELEVRRTTLPIVIDGSLSEPAWAEAAGTSPFINKWPVDSGVAEAKTAVRVLFDNQFIYVAAENYQRREDVVIQTLKRDQLAPFWNSDGLVVIFDAMSNKANGLFFGVNAGGAQIEAALNMKDTWVAINENWDNKWFSAVTVQDDRWTVEMAIPFSALRFDAKAATWGVNFVRNDMKRNVYSTWSRVPAQFNRVDLGHLGTLRWAEPLTPVQSRVTLIPYLSGGMSRNHEDGEDMKAKSNLGADAKVAVTPSLNLDLTYRPDFSNVDVDRQMTNVTRYSLLYPERRAFFLENADLFSNFGSWQVKPFFSRRIGLHDGDPVPIRAGARLSGNLTTKLRVGVMDIQTEGADSVSASNYFVTSLQQQVLARSAVRLYLSNRQTTRVTEGDTDGEYNRTMGGEFQYISRNGNLSASLRGHGAQTPEHLGDSKYLSATVGYVNRNGYGGVMVERVGENYINDLGFIPRLYNYDAIRDTTIRIGHYTVNPWFGLTLYPKRSRAVSMVEPNTWSVINYRTNGEFLERYTSVNVTVSFRDTRTFMVDFTNNEVQLPFAADVLDNDRPLPVAHYNFYQGMMKYTTDARKALSGEATFTYGGYYNGTRMEYGGAVNYRRQPWGAFGISYLQNDIRLPEAYGAAHFILIGPRTEISLSSRMWWTNFLQYNTQAGNFNINSRFQWRFKPMSDLFIVYTDNYACTDLKVKNRGVVFKITYWLNL